MDWIDWVIVAVILLSALTGLLRGFVKEVMALTIWGMGLFLSYRYYELTTPYVSQYISDKTGQHIVGFVAIFLVILIIGAIVNGILGAFLRKTGLNGTDRLLGMCFGIARGVFIVSLGLLVINVTLKDTSIIQASRLTPMFKPCIVWLNALMPDVMKKLPQSNDASVVLLVER